MLFALFGFVVLRVGHPVGRARPLSGAFERQLSEQRGVLGVGAAAIAAIALYRVVCPRLAGQARIGGANRGVFAREMTDAVHKPLLRTKASHVAKNVIAH